MRGREQSERPARLRSARCFVTGVDWTSEIPTPEPSAKAIYELYPLLRSLAAIHEHLNSEKYVQVPTDIAALVQSAYGNDRIGPDAWQATIANARRDFEQRLREREAAASAFLLGPVSQPGEAVVGWQRAGVGEISEDDPRSQAQVRDGGDSIEVLVVQSEDPGCVHLPSWLDRANELIPLDQEVPNWLARRVAASTLRLPPELSKPWAIDRVIRDLENSYFAGWQQSFLLKDQLVLVLDGEGRATVSDFNLVYDQKYGMEVISRE